jgi:hypothetical protein
VQMLSLENEHDIVARLDGTGNPDRANHVTVSFATQHGGVSTNHGIEGTYLPAAAVLDVSADPSVVAYRDSAAAFFTADGTVTAHRYAIERSHP